MDPTRIEEQIKDLLYAYLMQIFANFNRQLSQQAPNYKIVIGGGSAINYYFKEENVPVFKTHDFDLRCVFDGFIPVEKTAETDGILRTIQDAFINFTLEHLSYYMNNGGYQTFSVFQQSVKNIAPDFEFRIIGSSDFTKLFYSLPSNNPFLKTINYNYYINGKEHIASIIDLIIYTRSFLPHYGKFNIDDANIPYTLNDRLNMARSDSGAGFVKSYLDSSRQTIVKDGDIYYISLGFLLWDTVRVMNWYVRRGPDGNKFSRYIEKYINILRAFNDPTRFLRCDSVPMREYVQNCSR